MPILDSILDNKVLGREYKRGRRDGDLEILRRLIQKRFGSVPGSAEQSLAGRSPEELEDLILRVCVVESFEDLLK